MNDVDETDVPVRIPRANLRPRQRLGFEWRDPFGSIHALIFAVSVRMSSFLTIGSYYANDRGKGFAIGFERRCG